MAEILAGFAGVATIAGLTDVCCRLADKLYKYSQAVKNAPKNIQALVKQLQTLRELLEEVGGLLERYTTSPYVTEDGFSIKSLENLWQACDIELTEVEKSTARFTTDVKNIRQCLSWAREEQKIDIHCDALKVLSARITTALSTAGR